MDKDLSLIFKALGDSTRLTIYKKLTEESLCACKLLEMFNITQPTLSYHMKMLVDSGLVNCVKDGKWCNYSINKDVYRQLKDFFN